VELLRCVDLRDKAVIEGRSRPSFVRGGMQPASTGTGGRAKDADRRVPSWENSFLTFRRTVMSDIRKLGIAAAIALAFAGQAALAHGPHGPGGHGGGAGPGFGEHPNGGRRGGPQFHDSQGGQQGPGPEGGMPRGANRDRGEGSGPQGGPRHWANDEHGGGRDPQDGPPRHTRDGEGRGPQGGAPRWANDEHGGGHGPQDGPRGHMPDGEGHGPQSGPPRWANDEGGGGRGPQGGPPRWMNDERNERRGPQDQMPPRRADDDDRRPRGTDHGAGRKPQDGPPSTADNGVARRGDAQRPPSLSDRGEPTPRRGFDNQPRTQDAEHRPQGFQGKPRPEGDDGGRDAGAGRDPSAHTDGREGREERS